MTPIETLLDWLGKNHYYIGNDLLDKAEELKQMEKLKNHSEYMRGWYNGFNSKENETSNMEKTALQIAIENVDQCLNLEDVKGMLGILLELEKQQIMKSFDSGHLATWTEMAQQYYNETFKSN